MPSLMSIEAAPPSRLNSFMVNLRNIFDGKMQGWYYRERDGVFVATVSDTSKRKIHLGHFLTSEDAKVGYVSGKFKVLDNIVEDYKEVLPGRVLDGIDNLKKKILNFYNLTLNDLETAASLKIVRNRKSVEIGKEEIYVVDLAKILNMNYRHLYSLIYLKKWTLEKIISKYDSKGHFSLVDICSSSQVDKYGRPVI